jgi:hypothetical protein
MEVAIFQVHVDMNPQSTSPIKKDGLQKTIYNFFSISQTMTKLHVA